MGSPWTAPKWMKSNDSYIGGSLLTQYYPTYAQYFVKYIQKMKLEGITIDAITIQNEPEYGGNNPSMLMSALEQTNFIKNNLGPAFQSANISTKIVIFDHNCDNGGQYPINVLSDASALPFIDGSAFHLYAGDINTMTTVHNYNTSKNVYFTEQWTQSIGAFDVDLKWNVKNVVIGSMRNWSKTALQWNLASDPNSGPNTAGGCTQCKGAITISGSDSVARNVAYYIIAHAAKFVPAGSVRIGSNQAGNINNVAFKTPAGKKVLIALNNGTTTEIFKISHNGKWVTTALEAGSVGTYIW
jgi:glucosylceramidase